MFSASFLVYAIVVSPLNRFPEEGNCSAFQSFSCSNQEISNGLIRTILPFSNLRNLPFTQEMVELDEKIKPYRIVKGLEVSLVDDAPEEIRKMNEKFLKLICDSYDENDRLNGL